MIDAEVERLRRVRGSALRLRAVARALGDNKWTRDDALLSRGRCAAWRVARMVSGRLRSHPNERYQRDAGLGTVLKNSIVASKCSFMVSSRRGAMVEYDMQLRSVMRELNDARALTSATDLNDTFGRSQQEIKALIEAVRCETLESAGKLQPRRDRHPPVSNAASPFLTI